MLPVILNIQAKKENFDPENAGDKGYDNMHVYIPLPEAKVAAATKWLADYPHMQPVCEIVNINGPTMHFKPHIGTLPYFGVGIRNVNDYYRHPDNDTNFHHAFAVCFGVYANPETTRSLDGAGREFATILDDNIPTGTIEETLDALNPRTTTHSFCLHSIDYRLLLMFKHNAFPVHVTDDMSVIADLLKPQPVLSLTDATPAVPMAADDMSSMEAMRKYIAKLEEKLHKSVAQNKVQAEQIKILTKTVAALTAGADEEDASAAFAAPDHHDDSHDGVTHTGAVLLELTGNE